MYILWYPNLVNSTGAELALKLAVRAGRSPWWHMRPQSTTNTAGQTSSADHLLPIHVWPLLPCLVWSVVPPYTHANGGILGVWWPTSQTKERLEFQEVCSHTPSPHPSSVGAEVCRLISYALAYVIHWLCSHQTGQLGNCHTSKCPHLESTNTYSKCTVDTDSGMWVLLF